MLSGLVRCGACGGPLTAQEKKTQSAAYRCRKGFHVSRRQEDVDELVSAVIVARLTRPDLLELLAADSGDDGASAAATEAAEKQVRLDGFYDAAAAGELTPAALARIEAKLLPEIESARRRAVRVAQSPLLLEVTGADADARWAGLSLEQKREVINLLCVVKVWPTGRGRRTFDPGTVQIEWRTV